MSETREPVVPVLPANTSRPAGAGASNVFAETFWAGALSGLVAETVMHPFDTVSHRAKVHSSSANGSFLGSFAGLYRAEKRSPRIAKQYAQIGGKSPIGAWTALQGDKVVAKLNKLYPKEGPFKRYIAFRYAPPLTEEALLEMKKDGVQRAVAFSQYPHFSCTTTGSSLNHLWREAMRVGLDKTFSWSLVDRWPIHPTFVAAVARCVAVGLSRFPSEVRDKVVIVFSAHSVPMLVVNKGDQYVSEVAATVAAVMEHVRSGQATLPRTPPPASPPEGKVTSSSSSASSASVDLDDGSLGIPFPAVRSPHVLAWQSKVGFLPWMGPPTAQVLAGLGRQGHKYVLMVPIAFTSDHIETLFEIDVEYAHDAAKAGITQFERAPSLNGEEALTTAQAQIIAEHLGLASSSSSAAAAEGKGEAEEGSSPLYPPTSVASPQYAINCAGCINPACRTIMNPASPYTKLRDSYSVEGCKAIPGSPWPSAEERKVMEGRGDKPFD